MDHPSSSRSDLAVVANMRHYIVAGLIFNLGNSIKIDLVTSLLECLDLFAGNGKSRFRLNLRQCNPYLSPGKSSPERRE